MLTFTFLVDVLKRSGSHTHRKQSAPGNFCLWPETADGVRNKSQSANMIGTVNIIFNCFRVFNLAGEKQIRQICIVGSEG